MSVEEGRVIGRNIYHGLVHEHQLPFADALDADVLTLVAGIAPREMRKALLDALGTARLAKADRLTAAHFRLRGSKVRHPIGFTAH